MEQELITSVDKNIFFFLLGLLGLIFSDKFRMHFLFLAGVSLFILSGQSLRVLICLLILIYSLGRNRDEQSTGK